MQKKWIFIRGLLKSIQYNPKCWLIDIVGQKLNLIIVNNGSIISSCKKIQTVECKPQGFIFLYIVIYLLYWLLIFTFLKLNYLDPWSVWYTPYTPFVDIETNKMQKRIFWPIHQNFTEYQNNLYFGQIIKKKHIFIIHRLQVHLYIPDWLVLKNFLPLFPFLKR